MKIMCMNVRNRTRPEASIAAAFRKLGYEVEEYPEILDWVLLDDGQIDRLACAVREHHITHMFSVHMINVCAVVSDRVDVKYIAYIWDAPYLRLYSPIGRLPNCYFSSSTPFSNSLMSSTDSHSVFVPEL